MNHIDPLVCKVGCHCFCFRIFNAAISLCYRNGCDAFSNLYFHCVFVDTSYPIDIDDLIDDIYLVGASRDCNLCLVSPNSFSLVKPLHHSCCCYICLFYVFEVNNDDLVDELSHRKYH